MLNDEAVSGLLQEFFQGLESHMILTETYFRKISGLVLPKESQALEATLGQAQAVLREAHSRGVELEGVREVRAPGRGPSLDGGGWMRVVLALERSGEDGSIRL